MADLKEFAEQLVNLTVKEVSELATILKDEYGIEPAAAAVAVAAGSGAGGGDEAAAQTEFDVILVAPGGAKLNVVKAVKDITELLIKPDTGILNLNHTIEKVKDDFTAEDKIVATYLMLIFGGVAFITWIGIKVAQAMGVL